MSEKIYYIAQLEKGQILENELFGINQIKRATDRNNKPYIDLELIDKTGTIKAKIWSDAFPQIENAAIEEGKIVSVNAVVGEFNSTPQLTISKISQIEAFNLGDYIMSTSKDIDELWENLEDRVDDLTDAEIKTLLEKLLEKYEDELRKAPAAKAMHHHFLGGLLEHIVEMLEISDSICKLYPEADKNLVTAGIIFHDIGKIKELAVDGFQITYTKVGKLIGHITLGVEMLNNLDKDILSEETHIRLTHIILAHHTIREFGSPVTPLTIEAMIVGKIDDLSAKVRLVQKVLENNKDNDSEFAPREFGIEGEIYLGEVDKNTSSEVE